MTFYLSQRLRFLAVCLVSFTMISGCASVADDGILGKTLELIGLKKPEVPDGVKLPDPSKMQQKVTLRIHAADSLNTDDQGRSLALVVRIFKLRDSSGFLQSSMASFNDSKSEKASSFSQDIAEVKEVVLAPGKRHEVEETLSPDAPYLAVAALFRSPDHQRWRFVFDARTNSKTGVTIGAYRCALSVTEGQPVGASPESMRLAGVRCP